MNNKAASVDDTHLDLQNSSYSNQPHLVIANYYVIFVTLGKSRVVIRSIQSERSKVAVTIARKGETKVHDNSKFTLTIRVAIYAHVGMRFKFGPAASFGCV